ncbi:MAP3K epsilon protein kinase 1 [Bienertia sinuspersici]
MKAWRGNCFPPSPIDSLLGMGNFKLWRLMESLDPKMTKLTEIMKITSDKHNASCQWLDTIAHCKARSPGCYSSIESAQAVYEHHPRPKQLIVENDLPQKLQNLIEDAEMVRDLVAVAKSCPLNTEYEGCFCVKFYVIIFRFIPMYHSSPFFKGCKLSDPIM